jgi:membrane protein required for beta-lactamase induction
LRDAARKEEPNAAWALAFRIAQKCGWSRKEALERIERFDEK